MSDLIIISGPPCSGKTYLINSLKKKSETSHIKHELRINDNCIYMNANEFRELSNKEISKQLIIHYDSMRQFKRGRGYSIFNQDPFLDYLNENHLKTVIVVIMLVPLPTLLTRLEKRYHLLESKIDETRRNKILKLIKLYKDRDQFLNVYNQWFDYVTNLNLDRFLLCLSDVKNMYNYNLIQATKKNILLYS